MAVIRWKVRRRTRPNESGGRAVAWIDGDLSLCAEHIGKIDAGREEVGDVSDTEPERVSVSGEEASIELVFFEELGCRRIDCGGGESAIGHHELVLGDAETLVADVGVSLGMHAGFENLKQRESLSL